jgi:hypothetical protein
MYGTVARLRVKPGKLQELKDFGESGQGAIPGLVSQSIYQLDSDPNTLILVVAFESKDAYWANANSAEQNERYLELRQLLDADPEWMDGEIVQHMP